MLASVTGYTDAFWKPPAWYLTILEDLLQNPGQAKMEKMEKFLVIMKKFLVRMEKFPVKMERIMYVPGRIGAATSRPYLVSFRQDTKNVRYVACSALICDFQSGEG
jgi:hypothetical protein